MTVEVVTKATEGHLVRCVWFDDGEAKRGTFPAAALDEAETE